MDLASWGIVITIILGAMTVYNFILSLGVKAGATDAQLKHNETNEDLWGVRFGALDGKFVLLEQRTNERIEKILERLNEALLTMAREHPTKNDLQMVKNEILDRIDNQYGLPTPGRRRPKVKGEV